MNSYTEIFNAPWMFIWVAVILVLAILQSVVFMKKAWARAYALGMDKKDVKKALTTGISISIMPTLPVLIVFLALVPLLGTPLPWLRLSVIGSASYESYAASLAVQAVGEELVMNGFSVVGWVAAVWVMTVGGSACVLWSTCAIKPITMLYDKAEKINMKLVTAIGTGCMIGVMAYVSVAQGWSAINTKGIVFTVSFLVGAVLVWIKNKNPKMKWLGDFTMAISMIAAMVAACVIF